jgi:hypothetical protein
VAGDRLLFQTTIRSSLGGDGGGYWAVMAAQGSWAQVRQQARAQETQVGPLQSTDDEGHTEQGTQTESLFHTYAQFASKTDIDPKPSDEEQRTLDQLNEILEKVCATHPPLRQFPPVASHQANHTRTDS